MSKKYTVLELNNQDMQILVGKQYKSHVLIQQVYHIAIPPDAKTAEGTYNPAIMGPYLRDLFHKLELKKRPIIVSIIEENLLTQTHLFSTASTRALKAQVGKYVLEHYTPQLKHSFWNYSTVGTENRSTLVRINLLGKPLINSLFDSILAARLQPIALIPHSDALDSIMGSAKFVNRIQHDTRRSYGLIDYQGDTISLSLFHKGHLIFYKALFPKANVNHYDFLDILYKAYLKQYQHIARQGISLEHPTFFYLSGTLKNPLKAREILEKKLGKSVYVIREISTIQYSNPHSVGIVENLTASGCLSLIPLLTNRKYGCSNFFSFLLTPAIKRKKRNTLLGATTIALLLSCGFLFWNQQDKLNRNKNILYAKQQELQQLTNEAIESDIFQLEQDVASKEQYRDQLVNAIDFINKQNLSSKQIQAITEITPQDIIIEKMGGNLYTIYIQASSNSRPSIAKYESLLKESSLFEETFISNITRINLEGVSAYAFTVECTLEKGGSENES